MRSLALALTALALMSAAHAQSAQPWVKVDSAHFTVITDAGQRTGQDIAIHFELMRDVFAQILPVQGKLQSTPVRIIAFGHRRAMNDFGLLLDRPEFQAQRIVDSGDLVEDLDVVVDQSTHRMYRIVTDQSVKEIYLHSEDEDYILLNLADKSDWDTVYHEYAHRLLERNFAALPRWFSEGVAEYYSTARIGKSKTRAVLGRLPKGASTAIKNNLWIPMATLIGDGGSETAVADNSTFNLESCLVFEDLLSTHKLDQAQTYFRLYRQKTPTEEALQQAFGVSSTELEAEIRNRRMHRTQLSVDLPKPDGTYQVSLVQSLEVEALLADVHLHEPGYHRKAVKELQAVLEKDPQNSSALRGLALDRYRRSDIDGAMKLLGRALEANADDWLSHYYRARIMRKQEDPYRVKEMESEARQVIRLNPDFGEGYGILGSALASQGRNQEAAEAFEIARRLNPSDDVHAANLAIVYMALDRRSQAREIFVMLQNSRDQRFAKLAENYLKLSAVPNKTLPH